MPPEQNRRPRLLRLSQIIGNPKSKPPVEAIIPTSRTSWYEGIKDGRFPKPIKLAGGKSSFWIADEVYAVIEDARQDVQS